MEMNNITQNMKVIIVNQKTKLKKGRQEPELSSNYNVVF